MRDDISTHDERRQYYEVAGGEDSVLFKRDDEAIGGRRHVEVMEKELKSMSE